jgi:hypothetical protein
MFLSRETEKNGKLSPNLTYHLSDVVSVYSSLVKQIFCLVIPSTCAIFPSLSNYNICVALEWNSSTVYIVPWINILKNSTRILVNRWILMWTCWQSWVKGKWLSKLLYVYNVTCVFYICKTFMNIISAI